MRTSTAAIPFSIFLGCLITLAECGEINSSVRRQLQEDEIVAPALVPFPTSINPIISGERAADGEFPWYAVFADGVLCGGALVHPDIVVTAAHCVEGETPPRLRIGATSASNGNLVDVESVEIHPNYNGRDLENDIAILKLAAPVDNEVAQFNTADNIPPGGSDVIAMGFGRTNPDSGGGSTTLQKLTMEALSDNDCSAAFPDYNSGFNICVDQDNAGICFGDSGSPLVNADGLVLGVASFVIQACDSRFPDFYTRISSYSNWLQGAICDNSDNPPGNDICENVGDDEDPGGDGGDGIFDFVIECINTLIELCTGLLGRRGRGSGR